MISERLGKPPGDDGSAHPDEVAASHPTRRWVKAAAWSAVGAVGAVAVAAICVWAWHTLAPRFVLDEVFPDHNLALSVARATGVSGPSATVSQMALTQVRSLPCSDYRTAASRRRPGTLRESPSGALQDSSPPAEPAPETRIRSLRGLDRLTNPSSLGLRSNDISDLTPLASLDKLGDVMLADNRVTDLGPLAGLSALSGLGLSHNTISDLTPLAGLTGLSKLDASENQISDVTPLAHLPELRRLTLSDNQIVSAAPLRDMPALAMLNISQNRVADARTFAGFVTLEELWVGGNTLTDVTPLAALPALTGVDFEGTMSSMLVGLDVLRAHKLYVGGFA